LACLPTNPEKEGAEQPERDRNAERYARKPRQRTAWPVDIDLEPGQE
jgi:hypothetical protein